MHLYIQSASESQKSRSAYPAAAESHRDPLVWTAHDLDLALDAIAALLLEHPRGALEGDAAFYDETRRLRAEAAQRYTRFHGKSAGCRTPTHLQRPSSAAGAAGCVN